MHLYSKQTNKTVAKKQTVCIRNSESVFFPNLNQAEELKKKSPHLYQTFLTFRKAFWAMKFSMTNMAHLVFCFFFFLERFAALLGLCIEFVQELHQS